MVGETKCQGTMPGNNAGHLKLLVIDEQELSLLGRDQIKALKILNEKIVEEIYSV